MTTSNRGEVEDALAAWREAERALEDAHDDAARAVLGAEVSRLRSEYQRAVLASRGRIDELEGGGEDGWGRVDAGTDRPEAETEALRRG